MLKNGEQGPKLVVLCSYSIYFKIYIPNLFMSLVEQNIFFKISHYITLLSPLKADPPTGCVYGPLNPLITLTLYTELFSTV